jgi:hypothetical protein
MSTTTVFAVQIVWFLVAWATLARLAVWPWSRRLSPEASVAVWIAPQMFRILGLGLLVPNLSPGMPSAFAVPTAIGDSLTAVLALFAFAALQRRHGAGFVLAWACTVVGAADLLHALSQAARLGVAANLAAQWYVAAAGVPLMVVCHGACIAALLRARSRRAEPQASSQSSP